MTKRTWFYRGQLYRERDGVVERMVKLGWGNWVWKPADGFIARKLRRMVRV